MELHWYIDLQVKPETNIIISKFLLYPSFYFQIKAFVAHVPKAYL